MYRLTTFDQKEDLEMFNSKAKIDMPEFAPFQKLDAGVTTLDETAKIRSEARLEQIFINARRESPTVALPRRRASKRVHALRLAAIPVAAAAIIGTSLILPQNTGLVAPAFANWTATPITIGDIPEVALASYEATCREYIQSNILEGRWSGNFVNPPQLPAEATIAETRGSLTRITFQTTEEINDLYPAFDCLIDNSQVPAAIDQILFVSLDRVQTRIPTSVSPGTLGNSSYLAPGPEWTGGGSGWAFAGKVELGDNEAVITRAFTTSPMPREIEGWDTTGLWSGLQREEAQALRNWFVGGDRVQIRLIDGQVGQNVTGVVLHTRGGLEITATVFDGMFTAWFPRNDDGTGVRDGNIDHITVTLNDGTTIDQPYRRFGIQ